MSHKNENHAERPTDPFPSGTPPAPRFIDLFKSGIGHLALGLLLLELFAAIQVFTASTVLPLIAQTLQGERFYGVALAASSLAVFISLPLAGPLADRFGLRSILTFATPLYMMGLLISASAPFMLIFVLGRFIQGLASGFLTMFGLGTVATAFPDSWKPKILSLISAMWIFPALVGPSYAAFVATTLGWRWSFYLLLPAFLLACGLVGRKSNVLQAVETRRRPLPWGSTLLLTVGMSLVLGGASLGSLTGGGIVIGGLACVGYAVAHLFPAGTLVARRGVPAALAALSLLTFTFFGSDGLLSLFVTAGLGASLVQAGIGLTVGALAWSGMSLLQPRFLQASYGGAKRLVLLGAGLLLLGVGLLLFTLQVMMEIPGSLLAVGITWGAWALGGAGMGLIYPTLYVICLTDNEKTATTGETTSAVALSESLGSLLGTTIGGSFIATTTQLHLPVHLGLTLAYACFVCVAALLLVLATRSVSQIAPQSVQ
jgi:MFS family permease